MQTNKPILNELRSLVKRIISEEISKKTYSLYLAEDIMYNYLPIDRLKSILKCLKEELGEELCDYYVLQNETGNVKTAEELETKLGWDLSKAKDFDNISSLQMKIQEISRHYPEYKIR